MENLHTADQASSEPDTLLESLVILTRIHHKPYSAESLTAGLPLIDGRLTPELFIRAAERAEFSSKCVKRELTAISNDVLPVVLILDNGHACILIAKDDDGDDDAVDDKVQVIFPASGQAAKTILIAGIGQSILGKCPVLQTSIQIR